MPKTSKKDLKIFKKAVRYYYKKYKLSGWHVFCKRADMNGRADICPDVDTRAVLFRLGKHWSGKITKKKVRNAAKHEVSHLIIWPLYSAGWNRFVNKEQLSQLDEEAAQHITELLPD